MSYTTEDLKDIVAEINSLYGSEHYLPCTYTWCDYVHIISCFGEPVWDSDNYTTESKSVVRDMCYYNLNKILKPIWNQQLVSLKDEIMHHVKVTDPLDIEDVLAEYFEEEECQLNRI